MGTAIYHGAMMQEASRLAAADGQLGNPAAVRLLQIPHTAKDVQNVLDVFGTQLTREAKSKLMLDSLVPLPNDVVNQRYEPLFDKHIITGKTYTTAGGAVIPNELQYYNGEMAHFYGECTNVSAVNDILEGSGYQAMTLKYPGERRTVVAQLWSSRFTDTSIRPYNAMFIVIVVVRDDALPEHASIAADGNGASSALVMLDGSFEPAAAVYENRARLFLVRLLDTTRVAIDVGRERMGTDKRLGNIQMARTGRRLRLSIKDQNERGVLTGDLELADDPAAYLPQIRKAAATAGIPLRAFPRGTEYVYPAVARIGRQTVVSWQWHSDVAPLLQPTVPGTVVFEPRSEEGRMLLAWGFTPKVLGYFPTVRGVITGLSDQPERIGEGSIVARIAPITRTPPVAAAASTALNLGLVNPGETITMHDTGGVCRPGSAAAMTDLRAHGESPRRNDTGLTVERLDRRCRTPVLRLTPPEHASQQGTPVRLSGNVERPHPRDDGSVRPRWTWDTTFLGALTASLRKEFVGVTPDGLRINWHVTEGSFVGPGFDATVLPGAADWMRIRRDGVAIVSVQACFETGDGARVFGSYGGIFDLGPEGYARAMRDEYDQLPPVVVTPTYATADARLEWLNRAQCIGVGRVDMMRLLVQFDVYVVRVGERARHAVDDEHTVTWSEPAVERTTSLYSRLGGQDVIAAVTDDFVAGVLADRRLGRYFSQAPLHEGLRERVIELLCEITGGPCAYKGRDMKTAHKGMGISDADWDVAVDLLTRALEKRGVARLEQWEFLQIIRNMKSVIVEVPGRASSHWRGPETTPRA